MLTLRSIPIWTDNYIHMLDNGRHAIVIDPGLSEAVREVLDENELLLSAILNTHHHPDHVGGNVALQKRYNVPIYASTYDVEAKRIPGKVTPLGWGDELNIMDFNFQVLDAAAHTMGHIAYRFSKGVERALRGTHETPMPKSATNTHERYAFKLAPDLAHRPILFVGDSLFLGGCGRLFEGKAEDLLGVLQTFAAESPESVIACAHEYTRKNYAFGVSVLPDYDLLQGMLDRLMSSPTQPTVPGLLSTELAYNPFLLALTPGASTLEWAPDVDAEAPLERIRRLRAARDVFEQR